METQAIETEIHDDDLTVCNGCNKIFESWEIEDGICHDCYLESL